MAKKKADKPEQVILKLAATTFQVEGQEQVVIRGDVAEVVDNPDYKGTVIVRMKSKDEYIVRGTIGSVNHSLGL